MHKPFNILFLSNMMAEKGVWTLLEACSLLKEQGHSFHCHFVGKWSDIDEAAFNKAVRERKLETEVEAHGGKYGDEKIRYFKEADVFAFPTHYPNECFPLVLLEAMQQHKACIASNEGGISSIIEDGKTGYVVEKKNVAQLADRMVNLMQHPELCISMGQAGYEKYQREFTLQCFERRMVEVLSECVVGKGYF